MPVEAPAILEEAGKLRTEIREKRDKIKKRRNALERQWLTNIAFLYGKHYFAMDKRGPTSGLEERIVWEFKNLERKAKNARTSNYILPLYRSLLARFILMKQHISVDPATGISRDISSARVANELLEDHWDTVNSFNPVLSQQYCGMIQVLLKLFGYLMVCGESYLVPYFNPNTVGKAYLDGEVVEGRIGHVETEVNHPFELVIDPLRMYAVRSRIVSVEEIYNLYNVEIEPEKIGMSEHEKHLISMLEGQTEDTFDEAAEVFTYWQLPGRKFPQGRFCVFTKSHDLVEPSELAPEYKGRVPIFPFKYLDLPLVHAAQSLIEQLIPLQEEYNFTISRLYAYKKWMTGKLKVPDGCDLETTYDDEVGQIIRYKSAFGEPNFDTPPPAPTQLNRDLDRCRRDMEDVAAVHDVSMSRVPRGVKSGVAIENLTELDNTQIAPELNRFETSLGFYAKMVLDIMDAKYTEPRLLAIAGGDLSADVKAYTGREARGNRRIKISMGSTLPTSREARRQLILELEKRGLIDKAKTMELLEFGTLDKVFHNMEEAVEKNEIQTMSRGVFVEPMSWETHHIRLKVLTEYMNTDEFRKLLDQSKQDPQVAQVVQNFVEHRKMHQDFLLKEQGMDKPPAPVPPADVSPAVGGVE